MSKDLVEGYRCVACKKFHKYDGYVYAHCNVTLVHTCDCGQRVDIFQYKADPCDMSIENSEKLADAMAKDFEEQT